MGQRGGVAGDTMGPCPVLGSRRPEQTHTLFLPHTVSPTSHGSGPAGRLPGQDTRHNALAPVASGEPPRGVQGVTPAGCSPNGRFTTFRGSGALWGRGLTTSSPAGPPSFCWPLVLGFLWILHL
jgi:hypothetical protein